MPPLFNVCLLLCILFLLTVANPVEKQIDNREEVSNFGDEVSTFGEKVNTLRTVAKPVEEQIDNGEEVSTFPGLQGIFFMGLVIGTKWCGPGNIARTIYDLGGNHEVDACCRDHDLCEHSLAPGQDLYGLKNNRPFTAVSCACDETFRICLEQINSLTSKAVIVGYSASLPQCFSLEYEIRCIYYTHNTHYNIGLKRCIRYVKGRVGRDESENENKDIKPHNQWMDSDFHSDEEPQFEAGTIKIITTTEIPTGTTEIPMGTTAINERSGGNYMKQNSSRKQDALRIENTNINFEVQNTNTLDHQYDQFHVERPKPLHYPVQKGKNFWKEVTNNLNHQHQALEQYPNQPSPQYHEQYPNQPPLQHHKQYPNQPLPQHHEHYPNEPPPQYHEQYPNQPLPQHHEQYPNQYYTPHNQLLVCCY